MEFQIIPTGICNQLATHFLLPTQATEDPTKQARANQLYAEAEEAHAMGNHTLSFLRCREAAMNGSVVAIRSLGCQYLRAGLSSNTMNESLHQALTCLTRAAALNDFVSKRLLADLYMQGIGLISNPENQDERYEQAKSLYQQSAKEGSSIAMCRLGLLYLNRVEKYQLLKYCLNKSGITPETMQEFDTVTRILRQKGDTLSDSEENRSEAVKARKWLKKAAKEQNIEGMILFQRMLVYGIGGPRCLQTAQLLRQKITQLLGPDILATRGLRNKEQLYQEAKIAEEEDNLSQAMVLYAHAADLGSPQACLRLNEIYEMARREICFAVHRKFLCKRIDILRKQYLEKAAFLGSPQAILQLSQKDTLLGNEGEACFHITSIKEEAISTSSETMLIEIQEIIARALQTATPLIVQEASAMPLQRWFQSNPVLAARIRALLQQACNLRNPQALNLLGRFLYDGAFGTTEEGPGLQKIHEAADLGHTPSWLTLAKIYRERAEMTHSLEDKELSQAFLQKAVSGGDLEAIWIAGLLSLGGKEVPKDPRQGLALLQMAADEGDVRSWRMIQELRKQQSSPTYLPRWWRRLY